VADRYVAVLDAGTTCPRCFLYDHTGNVAVERSGEWRYRPVPDSSPFAREYELDGVWTDFADLIEQCLRSTGARPGDVAAITATSQRQGVVFLDDDGCELYGGPNFDLRAVFEGAAIDEEMGDRVYRATGHTPSMLFAPARLRWFRAHQPDTYDRIASVLTLANWLVWRLTGEVASERTLAGEAGLLDIHEREWCTELIEEMGLRGNSHVPLLQTGEVAGRITDQVARQTGLRAGVPVVVAGADTQCGLLGMGVTAEHQVGVVAGWSVPLQMVTAAPVISPCRKTWAGTSALPDGWVLESSLGDAGNSYRWLADTLFENETEPFQRMDTLVDEVPAGSDGTLVFLGPSRMDAGSLGLRQGGLLFPVPVTFRETGRGHLVRAALESICYAVRANLEQIEVLAKVPAADIALGGGMTRTRSFARIAVDVLGRPARVSRTPHVSALGAYLCAAVALGEFSSLGQASRSVRDRHTVLQPDPVMALEYESHYRRWLDIAGRLEAVDV